MLIGKTTASSPGGVAYQTASFGNLADRYAFFRLDDGDHLRGRFGLRVKW